MDGKPNGQTLSDEDRAYALGQLSVLRTFSDMLVAMPITILDRAIAELDKEFSAAVNLTFTWGTGLRRDDLEIARIFFEARRKVMALMVARMAASQRRMLKVTHVERD